MARSRLQRTAPFDALGFRRAQVSTPPPFACATAHVFHPFNRRTHQCFTHEVLNRLTTQGARGRVGEMLIAHDLHSVIEALCHNAEAPSNVNVHLGARGAHHPRGKSSVYCANPHCRNCRRAALHRLAPRLSGWPTPQLNGLRTWRRHRLRHGLRHHRATMAASCKRVAPLVAP